VVAVSFDSADAEAARRGASATRARVEKLPTRAEVAGWSRISEEIRVETTALTSEIDAADGRG